MISCSEEPLSPLRDTVINVTNFEGFELEFNTWSPDRYLSYLSDGGSLVIYFKSGRYSQNKSNKTFEVDQSVHRGAVLYQYIGDTLKVVGLGSGK